MAFTAYTVTIATPGTPQHLDVAPGLPTVIVQGVTYPSGASTPRGHSVMLSSLPTNTAAKNIWVGGPNLSVAGKTGVAFTLAPGQSVTIGQDDVGVSLDQIWVDTDSVNAATEKVGVGIIG